MEIPLRHHTYKGFGNGQETRHRMVGAHNDTLVLSARAFEILSVVSGMHLTPTQRANLLPILKELLADPSISPLGSGPLSQADVLGACLGLAVFALKHPEQRWTFAHVPASRVKTPDIYALSSEGSVWHVELKAVAPLDTEIGVGGTLDTCKRINAQRLRAVAQLGLARTPTSVGPAINVVLGPNHVAPFPTHGLAFVISVLPGAGLAGRADVRAVGVHGCPYDSHGYHRCTDHCLAASGLPGFVTSVVALTGETELAPVAPSHPPGPIVGALRVLNRALWSGSLALADNALKTLATALPEGEFEDCAPAVALVQRCLRATRSCSTVESRQVLVDALSSHYKLDVATIQREAERGQKESVRSEHVDISDVWRPVERRNDSSMVAQVVTTLGNQRLVGTIGPTGARLSPELSNPLDADVTLSAAFTASVEGKLELVDEEVILMERLGETLTRQLIGASWRLGCSFTLDGERPASGWVADDGFVEIRYN